MKYIDLVNSLVSTDTASDSASAPDGSEGAGKYKTLSVTNQGGLRTIQLNRPQKKNAITVEVSKCNYILL